MNVDLIITALGKIGLHEVSGAGDSPEILKMALEAGFPEYLHDDTAWCSMFANWVAKECGYRASNKLNARSWLIVGEEVVTPVMGDVAVLWRDNPQSWQGHIGFFIREDGHSIYLLGGNQGDSVSIMAFDRTRVLGYRRLIK